MRLRRRELIAMAGLATLSACSLNPPRVDPSAASLPSAFSIEGRFSLQYKSDRWMGTIDWTYQPSREKLTLESAGQSIGVFERLDGVVYAQLADKRTFQATTWQELTGQAIGVSLPFDAAPFWLYGREDRASEFKRIDADTFLQRGWTIAVLARDAQNRPTRVRWTSENIVLILLIDQWRTA
jgi:outer membrane biogenesis lipoprotein LolB